ncbi:hypothetical protein MTR67_022943 [Solanum verrucosum]|uniref:Uncharacterized protein n=1 Tax=Solanum verrucosum TaxID=315347 RepID=A0AAF0TYA4_SOLVR|nr:hypothetical protein MTR67_022943 [Solanum verrucosum]
MDTNNQKVTRQLKERRKEVCQALKEKIKATIEESSRRVAEQFRDAVPYSQSYKTSRMLKAKAKQ